MWAARLWWMLRAFGFDDAAVLDGGFTSWKLEGRPTCRVPCSYAPATFVARPQEGLVVRKEDVLAAIGDPRTRIVSALGRRSHRGDVAEYGRPGHIPGALYPGGLLEWAADPAMPLELGDTVTAGSQAQRQSHHQPR